MQNMGPKEMPARKAGVYKKARKRIKVHVDTRDWTFDPTAGPYETSVHTRFFLDRSGLDLHFVQGFYTGPN